MTIQSNDIPTNAAANSLLNNEKRVNSWYEETVTFGTAASALDLATLTPAGLNKSTAKWGPWVAPDPTFLTVSLVSASSGNYTVTVNGVTTANIAYTATDADVAAALLAIGVTATSSTTTSVTTITITDLMLQATLPTVSGDVGSISGGSPTAVATAGTATNGLHEIRGFVYPNTATLSTTEDTLVVVSTSGEYGYADILATVDSGDEAALKIALKDALIAKGFHIQGLAGIS